MGDANGTPSRRRIYGRNVIPIASEFSVEIPVLPAKSHPKLPRMRDYRLSPEELAERRTAHRTMRDIRQAYRINAIILLGQGRGMKDVADALLMDPETVRTYVKRYQKGGIDELLRMSYVGSEAWLDDVQLRELDYERFSDSRDASNAFLPGLDAYAPRLRTLLTENLQIVSN